MKDLIERMKSRWNENANQYDLHHNIHENIEEWKKYLSLYCSKNQKVLDIGCGTGFLTQLIREEGCETFALDLSIEMMNIAKKNISYEDIHWINKSFYETGVTDNYFDMVANKSVLWTLVYPDLAIKEWARVLKPGGKLISFVNVHKKGDEQKGHSHYDEDIEKRLPLKNAGIEEFMEPFILSGLFRDIKCQHLDSFQTDENHFGDLYAIIAEK